MTRPHDNLRIDGARLWASLDEMARIGPGVAGGNDRQTLTDADAQARRWLADRGAEVGCALTVDRIGSMFLRREGAEPGLAPVVLGSHLDTQPTGGRYDGVLGVLGALEVVRTLEDAGVRTRRPIVIANWTNEEGARFAPAMLGSGVFAGVYDLGYGLERRDGAGLRLGDELARIGWAGETAVGFEIAAYLELHIEQGPILEAEGATIGVVTHGQGLVWTELTLTGAEAHTGATPMEGRRDAGLAMAAIVTRAAEIARAAGPNARGSVGRVELFPNSRNVVPGKAVLTVDLRSPELATLRAMQARLEADVAEIAAAQGVAVAAERIAGFDPVPFDPTLVGRVRAAAERLGYPHRDIVSGAGHDACWIQRVAPSAMIFCPCEGGVSHNEAEAITPEWAAAGAQMLLAVALETAEVVG